VQDEKGDLLADSHNILNRWKNYSQLLNVHRVSDVRQIEIHMWQHPAAHITYMLAQERDNAIQLLPSPSQWQPMPAMTTNQWQNSSRRFFD
jgi:hypothetical protein